MNARKLALLNKVFMVDGKVNQNLYSSVLDKGKVVGYVDDPKNSSNTLPVHRYQNKFYVLEAPDEGPFNSKGEVERKYKKISL